MPPVNRERHAMVMRAESQKPLMATRLTASRLLDVSMDKVDELITRGALETVKLGSKRVGIKMRSIERLAEYGVLEAERMIRAARDDSEATAA